MDPDLDLPDLLTCTHRNLAYRGTRVSLDSVIDSFWEGVTPEEICQDLPSLSLAQVDETIAYHLKQRDRVLPTFRRDVTAQKSSNRSSTVVTESS